MACFFCIVAKNQHWTVGQAIGFNSHCTTTAVRLEKDDHSMKFLRVVLLSMAALWWHGAPAQAGTPVLLVVFDGGNGLMWCLNHQGKCQGLNPASVNYDGLQKRGGAPQIANTLRQAGYRVDERYFSSYWALHDTPASDTPSPGVLEALSAIDAASPDTRIVVIGASEGGLWTHMIAHAIPRLDVLVDFDVLCAGWRQFQDELPRLDPTQRLALEQRLGALLHTNPCRGVNVIPETVTTNLEVRTSLFYRGAAIQDQWTEALLTDVVPNRRPDGSWDGIWRFVERDERHGHLLAPDDPSVIWTSAMLLYLLQQPQLQH